jgi:para-nitrobenzyl esterase
MRAERGHSITIFRTTDGLVRGRRDTSDVAAVLGIPYAAPPFGANRFRRPQPATAWSGIRDCRDFGPIAPQSAQLPGAPSWSCGDEDILTVNVWTPATAGGPLPVLSLPVLSLPVLVWIHGGAYTFGSSAQPDFDGTALARADLVVVTCNYRLGFEGFGHVPSDEAGQYPDNRGLLDQIAALHWVRENIAAFGGDPRNVTVAGQSSGAASVAALMVMDRARGLFHRVIAHSVASAFYSVELAASTTRQVAAAAGCQATSQGLASASPESLVKASDEVVDSYRKNPASGARHYDPVIYGPVVDGDILATDPLSGTATGTARQVDLLVCHATEEYWLPDAVGSSAKVTTEAQLALFAQDFDLPDDLVAGYRTLMPNAPVLDVYLAIFGDLMFGEYTSRLAERHAESGGRTFLSCFARRRTSHGQVVRAWHCADIPFAFGNIDKEEVAFLIGGTPDAPDRELSRAMVRAWADFATTGDPGWPPVTSTSSGTPVTSSSTTVKVWRTDDDPATGETIDTRALWHDVDFPLLRPPACMPTAVTQQG